MIIPMLCVTIFVILVVWFLLPRVARLMIHTPTSISIFVCLIMVQLMAVFISMRCTFFLSSRRRHTRCSRDWSSDVCSSDLGADSRLSLENVSQSLHRRHRPVPGPPRHRREQHLSSEERRVGKECRTGCDSYV